jgi:hypothetical protein
MTDLARRHRAAAFGADDLQAAGGRDPVQPVTQGCLALEAVQRPPGAWQRVLNGYASVVQGTQHPVGVHVQGAQGRADQHPECLAIACPGGCEQVRGKRAVLGLGCAHPLRLAPGQDRPMSSGRGRDQTRWPRRIQALGGPEGRDMR